MHEDQENFSKAFKDYKVALQEIKQSLDQKIQGLGDRIENVKSVLESRIDSFKAIELAVLKMKAEVNAITEQA